METEIRSINSNPLLDRTELEVELNHTGESTPSEEAVVDRIAAERDLDSAKIEVDGIYTGFGTSVSIAHLKISGQLELEEPEEESADDSGTDYEEIVSGTISDAKDALEELDNPDYKAALEAEKDNKNRTTFTDWLENQL